MIRSGKGTNAQIRMHEIGVSVIYNPKATMGLTKNNHPQRVLPDFNSLRFEGQINTSCPLSTALSVGQYGNPVK